MKNRKPQKFTSDAEKEQIINLYLSGMSQKRVGALYNVTQGAVSNLLKRRGIKARSKSETSGRKYRVNHHYFDSIDTPDKAYWLGFITADGNIDGDCVSIKLNRVDRDHLVMFMRCMESSACVTDGINNFGVNYSLARIHSTAIATALRGHGVTGNKTWTIKPWHGSPELMPHYWRGVIDGDGWVSTSANGRTKRFYTVGLCGNHEIVNGFRSYVNEKLGYDNALVVKKLKSGNLFGQVAYTGTYRAKNTCQILGYNSGHIALPRKNESAIQIMSFLSSEKEPAHATDDLVRLIIDEHSTGKYTHADLSTKHNVGKGTVYNIIKGKGRFASLLASRINHIVSDIATDVAIIVEV